MNSMSIYSCKNCDQLYCAECSNASCNEAYCSSRCQKEREEESDQ